MQLEVTAFQAECAKDLEAAEPVIAAAEKALNSLDKVPFIMHCAIVKPQLLQCLCRDSVGISLLAACHTLDLVAAGFFYLDCTLLKVWLDAPSAPKVESRL